MKNQLISLIKSVTNSVKTEKEPKTLNTKRFINNDGTIAESHSTYKEFRTDLIKSQSYGW